MALICKRGHDKSIVGKTCSGNCKQCYKEYRQTPKIKAYYKSYMKKWHTVDKMRIKTWKEKGINISLEEYQKKKEEQLHRCAICGRVESEFKKALGVDHCHKTGKIRGLLCSNCNAAIGQLNDDVRMLQKAILYLEKYADTVNT